jgi:tRNA A37 threonylcarbamoyladenosine synthetase subunit TsaC/SUA5/YrdC
MKQGAVIIYPTDSVYAMGCDPESKKGVEKLFQIKNSDPNKRQLTFMCSNISMASTYANQISILIIDLSKNIHHLYFYFTGDQ